MTTTISPGLGHAPLFTQAGTGSSPGYDAIDRRRSVGAGLQEGVLGVTSFEVTQRAAGANLSVDIAANVADALGSGVAALVQGDAVTAQGLYPVPPHSAVINEAITAAHASLPRVDAVILEIQDTTHDASGANLARVRVVAGTATSGATLNNARDGSHGGAAIPSSALHLADVLVAGGATTIANSAIRDRRKWARGAYCRLARTTDVEITSTSFADIASELSARVECSGAPVCITLSAAVNCSGGPTQIYFRPMMDGAAIEASGSNGHFTIERPVSNAALGPIYLRYILTPAAGSHVFTWQARVNTGTWTISGDNTNQSNALMTVEEVLRQNTKNNATTTG